METPPEFGVGAEPIPDGSLNGRLGLDSAVGRQPIHDYGLLTIGELRDLPPPQWLVRGLLVQRALLLLWGAPGCCKTFLALDLALRIAAGMDCYGRPVKQGAVVYVAAEGYRGLSLRIRAWESENGAHPDDAPFYVLGRPVQFLDEKEVSDLIGHIRGLEQPVVLVVIDTLARCFDGGDENTARDMGAFVNGCGRIQSELDASVLVLHHKAKGSDTERGSSALPGAVDTSMMLTKNNDRLTLTCSKQKDAEEFEPLQFELQEVDLGDLGDGEGPRSSCVVSPLDPWTNDGLVQGVLGPNEGVLLRCFMDQAWTNGIRHREWKIAAGIGGSSFNNALQKLKRRDLVAKCEGNRTAEYTLTGAGKDHLSTLVQSGPAPPVDHGESGPSPSPPLGGGGGVDQLLDHHVGEPIQESRAPRDEGGSA